MYDPPDDEIAYGVEIRGVYDGVLFWVLKDGTLVNRWTESPGRLAAEAEKYMATHKVHYKDTQRDGHVEEDQRDGSADRTG